MREYPHPCPIVRSFPKGKELDGDEEPNGGGDLTEHNLVDGGVEFGLQFSPPFGLQDGRPDYCDFPPELPEIGLEGSDLLLEVGLGSKLGVRAVEGGHSGFSLPVRAAGSHGARFHGCRWRKPSSASSSPSRSAGPGGPVLRTRGFAIVSHAPGLYPPSRSCFNPLPIGAVSASGQARHERGHGPEFQSPSYRGCLCISGQIRPERNFRMSFQSPSYRGCLCIVQDVSPLARDMAVVSIPFLSGLSLHQHEAYLNNAWKGVQFQSPSYRGCLCIQDKSDTAQRTHVEFQSPSYRGCLCIRISSVPCGRHPLRFQSPSYRGCLCICIRGQHHRRNPLRVSIPFLSGLSLHLRVQDARGEDLGT